MKEIDGIISLLVGIIIIGLLIGIPYLFIDFGITAMIKVYVVYLMIYVSYWVGKIVFYVYYKREEDRLWESKVNKEIDEE